MASVVSAAANKLYSNRVLSRKVAGEHSLNIGEIAAFIIALLVYKWGAKIPFVGKWKTYICFFIILVAFFIW